MPWNKPITNGPVTPSKRKSKLVEELAAEPETPPKVRHNLNAVLEQLNATWSLNLPHVRGASASQMESASAIAKRCSARLRYLCFRLESLDAVISDFEDRARVIHSNWVFKPGADRNLIVPRNFSDPSLGRTAAKGKMRPLTDDQILQLLDCLDSVLEGPYQQARTSDSFKTTTAATASVPIARCSVISGPTTKRTKPNIVPRSSVDGDESKATTMTSKRPSTDTDVNTPESKRSKARCKSPTSIRRFFAPIKTPTLTPQQLQTALQRSFDSVPSPTDEIFSQANDDSGMPSSNDTTVLEPDFPDTQDGHDLLQDPEILRSLDGSSPASTLGERLQATFKPLPSSLPTELDLDFKYELQSLSLDLGIHVETLLTKIRKECNKKFPTAAERHKVYKTIAGGIAIEHFTERGWDAAFGMPEETKHHRSMYQSVTLSVDTSSNDRTCPYKVKLNAPVIDKSCRLYRKFDPRKLMILNIPVVRKGELSKTLTLGQVFEEVVNWLSGVHHIAGRQWRAFYIDDQVRVRKDEVRFRQVHLFAVDDTDPGSLGEFMNWHIPWKANLKSTDLKLFARFKLALSKTTPTVVLEQDEFIAVRDKQNPGGQVMDDGAGLMSFTLAKAIAACAGLFEVPSIFQGRISGAKGVWMVVPDHHMYDHKSPRGYWITVSPSQLKIKPHPRYRVADPEHRTFEISAFSKTLRPASLNTQLITVLHSQGVTKELLASRLKDHSREYYETLNKAANEANGPAIRAWLQRYHGSIRNGEMTLTGSVPSQKTDKQYMLLDAGFLPRDCEIMHEMLRQSLKERLTEMAEKINPELAESATPFIIPDPYGVLEEGTAMLCLPEGGFVDPRTGMPFSHVDGRQALVARNPAYWPSDMQKIRLVYNLQLACFKNVLIFSTKGLRPLADLLSGGDYDGDKAFITWDKEIVIQFESFNGNAPNSVRPEHCYIQQCSKPLFETFKSRPQEDPTTGEVEEYLKKCLDFNLRMSPLGMVSNEHAKYVYWKSVGEEGCHALGNPGAIKLGAVAGFLVDAPKQGYLLAESDFWKLRRQICGPKAQDEPAYKMKLADHPNYNSKNINDYLKFVVAKTELDDILHRWANRTRFSRLDDAIKHNLNEFKAMATEDNSGVVQMISEQLHEDIAAICSEWKDLNQNESLDARGVSREISQLHRQYLQIEPLLVEGHEDSYIYRLLKDTTRFNKPLWPAIRASYIYCHTKSSSLAWNMAADQLCEIKAKSMGLSVTLGMSMWSALKIDKRIAANMSTWGDIEYNDIEDIEEDETQYFDAESELPSHAGLMGWLNP